MVRHGMRAFALLTLLVPLLLSSCNSGGGTATGKLRVTIAGLPSGVQADVTVSGPHSFSKKLTATQTLNGLTPGSYTVAAQSVPSGQTTYNATVSGNTATTDGGGIDNAGTVDINDSTVEDNSSTSSNGGGIFNEGTGTVDIESSTIVSGNTAVNGGGIYNSGALTLTNITVSGNTAMGNGGGIVNEATLTLTNSTVSGNTTSGFGGGIYSPSASGTVVLTNSTVSGNSSGAQGGGVNNNGALTLVNSTISGNSGSYGGGIENYRSGTTLTLKSTIVAGNTAVGGRPDINSEHGATVTSDGYNLIGDGTGSSLTNGTNHDQMGTGSSPIKPDLGPLQDNGGPTETMALQAGSPAIDQIPVSTCTDTDGNAITTDQRGDPRPSPAGGMCDIGAFEVQQ